MLSHWSQPARILVAGLGIAVFATSLSAQENRFCLACHGDTANFAGQADSARLVVTQEEFAGSVHGGFGMSCVTCHQGFEYPHPDEYEPVRCGACHGAEDREYIESVHGYAAERGNPRAPTCAGCHGAHDIRRSTDPESHTYHARVAETCTECHSTGGLLTDEYLKLPAPALQYARSVHGTANGNGDQEAATCTDCHGVHDLRGHFDPESKINRRNVSATCGACHPDVTEEYDRSIHGRAVAAGVSDSPTCTDCHGEHLILHPADPDAGTHSGRLAAQLCGDCHDDPVIIAKYALQEEVVLSYRDSYHGWATRRASQTSATCVSCHTTHLVLPAADPLSSVAPGNVVATCRQCHEGAEEAFARSYDHRAASVATNKGRRIVRTIYIILIAVVIGGMAIHNAIIFNYYLVEKRRRDSAERGFLRFDKIQIAQHATLATSFILLVLTGFALRYPEAGWARVTGLAYLAEPVRSTLHRALGVGLILFGIVHVLYILFMRRGRDEFKAMTPNTTDAKDFVDNMRFYTWRSPNRARFGRYDYTQKAEYWALVWGTVLMALTGVVLWFPAWATGLFPTWIVSISETIHFYEAWLATLAIIVWHFFFVLFHPEVYPMSWIWLTGKMPEHEARAVHGRWYDEELAGGGDVRNRLTGPGDSVPTEPGETDAPTDHVTS
jgi:formate dehydrogenase gamma subunit